MGRRPPAGKTQKSENFFQKNRKRLFPKFYLDSKLKVENPKMPRGISEKKCARVCTGIFGVIFDTFQCFDKSPQPIFDNPKFQVFSGRFAFCVFCIFALLQI
jgi:hypothetical protein